MRDLGKEMQDGSPAGQTMAVATKASLNCVFVRQDMLKNVFVLHFQNSHNCIIYIREKCQSDTI